MPLAPIQNRTLLHTRSVTYNGFEREDGLWDIEGELIDSKPREVTFPSGAVRKAHQPIHHMWIRTTVNRELVVQAIEVAMDAHPLEGCPQALDAMQKMVGCSMARGWRKSIELHLGNVAGCTHMRELLFNMATATFQTLPQSFRNSDPTIPPRHLGQCKGWDFNGEGVKKVFPMFFGHPNPIGLAQKLAMEKAAADAGGLSTAAPSTDAPKTTG